VGNKGLILASTVVDSIFSSFSHLPYWIEEYLAEADEEEEKVNAA